MNLSEQTKLLERENQRLRNLVDSLMEQLEEQSAYIKSADYFIDSFAEAMEQYVGNNYEMASKSTQERVRAYRRLRPGKETNGKTP